jgi:hypothetical protein
MVRAFLTDVVPSKAAQFMVDEGNKNLESFLVARPGERTA